MTALAESFTHNALRFVLKARVALSVRMANTAVTRAFQFKPLFPVEKVAAFSGAGMAAAVIFIVMNYTFPGSTSANIPPAPRVTAKLVKPERTVKPEAPPAAGIERLTKVKSDIKRIERDLANLAKPSLSLPFPESEALYTLIVDKSRKELFVLEETRDNYKIVTRYKTSLGSETGDKNARGDNKTPEGLYRIIGVKQKPELPGKYGPMAFVLNYPNEVDIKRGKTGGGIWIHGSGMGNKTERTEGCIEINDKNIVKLAEFAERGAPVYIFPESFRVPIRNNAIQKNVIAPDTVYSLKEGAGKIAGKF